MMETERPPNPPPPSSKSTARWGGRLSLLLVVSGTCGLLGLGLTVLPMVGITPLRLALSFGLGQPLCALALILYLLVVALDLRRRRVL